MIMRIRVSRRCHRVGGDEVFALLFSSLLSVEIDDEAFWLMNAEARKTRRLQYANHWRSHIKPKNGSCGSENGVSVQNHLGF